MDRETREKVRKKSCPVWRCGCSRFSRSPQAFSRV